MADLKKHFVETKRPFFGANLPAFATIAIQAAILSAIITLLFLIKDIPVWGFIPAFIIIYLGMCIQSLYISPDGQLGAEAGKRAIKSSIAGLVITIVAIIVILVS
ncbi:MAG: hypothetical protein Q3972_08440 [Corynebacterium sp.]|nr:hypothetical protein [Corynebacterium sp.]